MADKTTTIPVEKSKASEKAVAQRGWPAINQLRNEIDRIFDDFNVFDWRFPFGRHALPQSLPQEGSWNFVPAVDLTENTNEFKISAELPGMEAKDIEIKVSNGSLIIKGEKEASSETKEDDYYVSERQYGSFCRTLALPEGVDRDKIEAEFANGVLNVKLPKSAEAIKSEKSIKVKAA